MPMALALCVLPEPMHVTLTATERNFGPHTIHYTTTMLQKLQYYNITIIRKLQSQTTKVMIENCSMLQSSACQQSKALHHPLPSIGSKRLPVFLESG